MIHLSNLELDEHSSLFSRRDLQNSSFQDTIIKVLCLGKSILNLIKENHGLNEDDVIAEHMIPITFNEEKEFLSDSNTNSLKHHYMTFHWNWTMLGVNDERRQTLPSKVIWDGTIDRFEVFRNSVEAYYE
jgi:hypothetical protein